MSPLHSVRRKPADMNRFLSELNESFSIITDLEQLKDNFSARLKEIFQTRNVSIFLLHPDLNRFLPVDKLINSERSPDIPYFLITDRLIFWLSVNKKFLDIIEERDIFHFLGKREQDLLEKMNIGLIYPFIVMNQVKGLVCIGRRTGKPFSHSELQHMKMLLDQAGFAFENSYHYHLQKERTHKMYRADRMAILGELAAGAAHEIRNPLTTILSSIQFLKKKLKHSSDIEIADDLISEVGRINDIIEGMLSFAKPREPTKEKSNLKILLSQSVQLISNTARKSGVAINLNYPARNEELLADPAQLKQVFLNVLMNAIQSIEGKEGLVTIDVNEIAQDLKTEKSRGGYIIEVSDNGKGIAPENMERIFDPFFTTRDEGTGLGLSVTYAIIRRHGGEIELSSEPNRGTKVKIRLPAE